MVESDPDGRVPPPDKTKAPPGSLDHIGGDGTQCKWEISYRQPYGRCIVAREDINQGEVIFTDQPIITGPKLNSGYTCLGCYKLLPDPPEYRCSKCSWPMCSSNCETKGYHPLECSAFSAANFELRLEEFGGVRPLYECILPLRCLLLQSHDDKKWATLQAMESHDSLRKGTDLWDYEQANVCELLREQVLLPLDEALIHSVCGALDVNCHEVRSHLPGTREEYRVRGVYPLCAMMSHECSCNTIHTILDDHTMIMRASRDIKRGDQVTGIYTHLLSGTTERRKHLRYGKFFDCVCSRCSDPTELGSFFSALRCTRPGCDGDVLCSDPLRQDNKADYACNKCNEQVEHDAVTRLTERIARELEAAGERDPAVLEEIFNKYSPLLHPNHFHLIAIKSSLSQMYGRVPGYLLESLSPQQLQRKVQCCQDLLAVLDVLDPGLSRLAGLTKYELHVPLLLTVNRTFQQRLLTREDFLSRLQGVHNLLEDTISCLQFESSSSFEGQICKIARDSASELRKWMSTVQQLPESNFLPVATIEFDKPLLSGQDITLEDLLKQLEEQ